MSTQAPADAPKPPPPPNVIKIDGREIPYEPGDTIIRAAHRAGIDIPHYCWHPGLSVAANCRMCLVELPPPPGRPAMRLDILKWDAAKKDYVVDNKPKLQPACQQGCSPGMEVLSESSDHVAEARAAVQELLLVNHPVDCPICDQAGECRLQDYWLEHQRTGKRMQQEIVHKAKAQVFGPTIVYDAERCILCTRCIRVSDEVAKDPVLEIRERGNLGEIFVSPGRELDHDYTLMTEHVCPVGALTSTDFRFKARVWFLRSARTVCQGCSTGCNAYLDFDPRTNAAQRYRPRDNMEVNKYWMCDEGMLSYKHASAGGRVLSARVGGDETDLPSALDAAKSQLAKHDPAKVAIVLSAQHSLEDNFALVTLAKTYLGANSFFITGKRLGKADDILMSADKNPNTTGVVQLLAATGDAAKPLSDLLADSSAFDHVIALGSEVEVEVGDVLSGLRNKKVLTIASHDGPLARVARILLPATVWAETDGTYVNKQGKAQQSDRALRSLGDSVPGWLLVAKLGRALGFAMNWRKLSEIRRAMNTPTGAPEKAAVDNDGAKAGTEARS